MPIDTKPSLLVVKYIHFRPSTTIFLWESTDTPRIELVDRVAVAAAVGAGFDVILWYFIWLCWFDCARSSILPDVSDILQKHFALLARWSTRQNFNACLMVLMHHLNADPEVEGEKSPRGESLHGIWKSDVRGVSGGEEFSQNADTTLERNIKCSNLSQGFCSMTKKKGSSSLSNNTKLTITHFTFFKKGSAKLMPLWENSQAFMHANEVNSEQMCSTPELKLEQLSFFLHSMTEDSTGNRRVHFSKAKNAYSEPPFKLCILHLNWNIQNIKARNEQVMLFSHYFSSNLHIQI